MKYKRKPEIRYYIQEIIDWIYPRRCPVCDRVVKIGSRICGDCIRKLYPVGENYCVKCGKELGNNEREYCEDCNTKTHEFIKGRGLYIYKGDIKKSIYSLKYHKRREYADFYGKEISEKLGEYILKVAPDALIPVPISRERMKKRGYNQAECIAKVIAKNLEIPMINDYVIRIKDTTPQKELDILERQNNLKKAFKIRRNDVKLDKVMIVDDIYTTGSTIDAVARALKKGGVNRVYFVVLAVGIQ